MKLLYPVSKSHFAFLASVDKMFSMWPNQIYGWTFTFKIVMPEFRYHLRWKEFSRELQDRYGGGIKGLKVTELHPGGHGIHFHCLFNQRVSIHWVRRIARRFDMGRVQAFKLKTPDQGYYFAKYLTKKQEGLLPGTRKWGTVGGWKHTRARDVQIESTFTRNVVHFQDKLKKPQFTMDCIQTIYKNTQCFGDVKNWPIPELRYYHGDKARHSLFPPTEFQPRGKKGKQLQAVIWRTRAGDIWKKQQTAEGKKIYILNPRGDTGDSPVKKKDKTLSISADYWDTFPKERVGTPSANRES